MRLEKLRLGTLQKTPMLALCSRAHRRNIKKTFKKAEK
jgi:hypothetical protein